MTPTISFRLGYSALAVWSFKCASNLSIFLHTRLPCTEQEICAVSRISKKEIGRCFKLILKALETSVELITTGDFMSRFCTNLGLPPKVSIAILFELCFLNRALFLITVVYISVVEKIAPYFMYYSCLSYMLFKFFKIHFRHATVSG